MVVAVLLYSIFVSRMEGFEDTKLDRLCDMISTINVDDSVRRKCTEHTGNQAPDYCVKGCDPVSLCKYPAFEHCATQAKNCDVTHTYVGPHISAYHDDLPRFFLFKEGFCFLFEAAKIEWPYVRTTTALRDVMMCFPASIAAPYIHKDFRDLTDIWTFNTSDKSFRIPYKDVPSRPPFLTLYELGNPNPVRTPGFAVYHTSTNIDGNTTHKEVVRNDVLELMQRDVLKRRPYSPKRMFLTFFQKFADNTGAHNGYHMYRLSGGKFTTSISGDIDVGSVPVSLVSSLEIDMENGGFVLEEREIVFYAGIFVVSRKLVPASEKRILSHTSVNDFRYFLGSIDAGTCTRLLQG